MQFPARYLAVFLLVLLVSGGELRGQNLTFTTLAGGTAGTNDGLNMAAQFDFPAGIAPDNNGNFFVTDLSNNTIRKVTPVGDDWVVTTIAGLPSLGAFGSNVDGTNGEARFYHPEGIVSDGPGNFLVVDHDNDTIRRLTYDGTDWSVITIAGQPNIIGSVDGTNNDVRFWGPRGIAMDVVGNFYIADASSHIVRKMVHVGTNWVVTTIAGLSQNFALTDGTNSNARFNFPFSLAIDSNTNIYVADFGNNAIRKIRPIGTNWAVTTIAGNGTSGSADGTNSHTQFNSPAAIALDNDGILYVSDQFNNTIRKLTPLGTNWAVTTIGGVALVPGANNGLGTNAHFSRPWGLNIDAQKHLFIVDRSNHAIREGVPASSAAPILRITRSGPGVLLSWPLAASGFKLESSSAISATWTSLTTGVAISGNYFWFTNNANSSQTFYRLRGPAP